jgi:hypothetical protein
MKDVKAKITRQPRQHMEASVETPEGQATGALWPVRYPGAGGPSSFSFSRHSTPEHRELFTANNRQRYAVSMRICCVSTASIPARPNWDIYFHR